MFKYILIFFIYSSYVVAGKPIHPIEINTEVHETEVVKEYTYINEYTGVATGMSAAQIHMDYGTYKYQAGIGFGSYGGSEAVSIGFGKRFCEKCGLINGSVSRESNKTGFGLGYNWRF